MSFQDGFGDRRDAEDTDSPIVDPEMFQDGFDDGRYADKWSVTTYHDVESVTERDGVLTYRSPPDETAYAQDMTIKSVRWLDASGVLTVRARHRVESGYWSSKIVRILPQSGDEKIELKEKQHNDKGFTLHRPERSQIRLDSATGSNDWIDYELTIDFDQGRIRSVRRNDQTYRIDRDVHTDFERFRLGLAENNCVGHYDSLSVVGATGRTSTPTETRTRIPPETRTPTPTGARTDTQGYDLRAGDKLRVSPNLTPLYVIRDIPELPPETRAVTTTEYELVGPSLAEDALAAEYHSLNQRSIDYRRRLAVARRHREQARDLRVFGRALDAGWDLTVIANALLVGQPPLALGNAISLTTDVMNWSYTDYADPFRESFTKMTATLASAKSIEAKARYMRQDDNIAGQIATLMERLGWGYGVLSTGGDLATAWDDAYKALSKSSFPVGASDDILKSADDLASQTVDDAVAAGSGFFLGFAIGLVTGEISSVIKAKTKIHTAELAYETVRIPVLKRLESYQNLARGGKLSYPGSVSYSILQAVEMQLGSLLYQVGSDYWAAISDAWTGGIWDIVSNADTKAENYGNNADIYANAAKALYLDAGGIAKTINDRYQTSLNQRTGVGGRAR